MVHLLTLYKSYIFITMFYCLILNSYQVSYTSELSPNDWKPVETDTFRKLTSRFYAYTDPKNPEKYNIIIPGNTTTLETSGLITGHKIIIILHAYGENATDVSTSSFLKNAFLKHDFHNIIIVQWGHHLIFHETSDIFRKYNYALFKNSPEEGRNIAEFIAFIVNSNKYGGADNIHIIGISLGANVAGSVGYHLQKRYSMKLGRITGLDPPGVFLQFVHPTSKLDKSDATFVDVLHTDIGLYGTSERMGHADFFSNGGGRKNQPGCKKGTTYLVLAGITGIDRRNMCGHVSAVFTYRKSLLFNMFACRCDKYDGSAAYYCGKPSISPDNCTDWTTFGEHSKLDSRGSYFLYT